MSDEDVLLDALVAADVAPVCVEELLAFVRKHGLTGTFRLTEFITLDLNALAMADAEHLVDTAQRDNPRR